MNKSRLIIVFYALVMTFMLFSCSNKTPSQTITSLEIEFPAGDVQLTDNGYALFSGRTYSASKDFATRGYINNGSSYSYVKATVYVQDALAEEAQAVKMGDSFRCSAGSIYNVWTEYNGMKSKVIKVCGYGANMVFSATLDVDTFDKDLNYSDLIKKVRNAWYYTESGALKSCSGSEIPTLTFLFANSETSLIKELTKDSDDTIGNTNFDLLFVYSDPTTPFNILKQIKVYDSSTDFDEIALNTVRIDRANRSLKGLRYVKRLNGTTIGDSIDPFESDTTNLKHDHSITISADGGVLKTFNAPQSVQYDFEINKKYTITLTLKSGGKEYSKSKSITFTK